MDPNRLKAIPLFSHLGEDEAKRLAAFATETSVADGQILMKEGDYSTELIAIEEGSADVIVKTAAAHHVQAIRTHEDDLEEIFLRYYRHQESS